MLNRDQRMTTYDVLGEVQDVNVPATASAIAEHISYSYDPAGRVVDVSDHRGVTSITYEAGCDRVHSVTDPVTGTISCTYIMTGDQR